ncbi:MAG: hypothetical protein ACC662_10540, partial [Planctomycetota bacterium]
AWVARDTLATGPRAGEARAEGAGGPAAEDLVRLVRGPLGGHGPRRGSVATLPVWVEDLEGVRAETLIWP